MENNNKTADYTRRAIDKYMNSKDRLTVYLEKGTKEAIYKKYGENIQLSTYIKKLVDADLSGTDAGNIDEKPAFIDENDDDFPFKRE